MGGGTSKDKGEHPITKRPYKGTISHHEPNPNKSPEDPEAGARHPITKRPYKSGARNLNYLAKQETTDKPDHVEDKS